MDSIYIVALLPILFIGAAYINLRKFYEEANEKRDIIEPYMQRNGTLSMFISTIIPSFIILGFIASSITSHNANTGPLFFSIIVSLPALYALGAYASQRRLIDVFES